MARTHLSMTEADLLQLDGRVVDLELGTNDVTQFLKDLMSVLDAGKHRVTTHCMDAGGQGPDVQVVNGCDPSDLGKFSPYDYQVDMGGCPL